MEDAEREQEQRSSGNLLQVVRIQIRMFELWRQLVDAELRFFLTMAKSTDSSSD